MSSNVRILIDVLKAELQKVSPPKEKTVHSDIREFSQSRTKGFFAARVPDLYQNSVPLFTIFNSPV